MGGMGRAWWKTPIPQSPDFELVAIVDIADAPLEEAGEALSIPRERRFKDLEDAIEQVPADAVLTVTPPDIHVQHARLAFANGLHLLTEKPIGHDLSAAKEMVDLARRANRQLMVAQNYRYSSIIQKLIRVVREKPLGSVGHAHIDFYIPADFTGTFRETMKYPLLVDMAIHHIDLIRAVTGKNIARITAHTFNPSWSWYQHHAGLKMLLELEDGTPITYSGDWSGKGKSTSWNGSWRIQCADGSIHLDGAELTLHRCDYWSKNPASEKLEIPELAVQAQAALLARFAESIRSGKPAETSGEDNLHSFAAVMAAMRSAEEKRGMEVVL